METKKINQLINLIESGKYTLTSVEKIEREVTGMKSIKYEFLLVETEKLNINK